MILIYAMVGISIVMLTGWSGNVSLGHWAFVGVGAMLAGKLASQANPTRLLPHAADRRARRCGRRDRDRACRRCGSAGLFLGVTTLAFAVVVVQLVLPVEHPDAGGGDPASGALRPDRHRRRSSPTTTSVSSACSSPPWRAGTSAGRAPDATSSRCVTTRCKRSRSASGRCARSSSAFAISGFFAALAGGALYAYHQQSLRFDRFPAGVSRSRCSRWSSSAGWAR